MQLAATNAAFLHLHSVAWRAANVTAFYFECTHIWCVVCQHFEHKNKLCNEQKSDNLVFVFVYHEPGLPHCRLYHPPFGRSLRQNCVHFDSHNDFTSNCHAAVYEIVALRQQTTKPFPQRLLRPPTDVSADVFLFSFYSNAIIKPEKTSLLSVWVEWESRRLIRCTRAWWWSCQSNQISNACVRGALCRLVFVTQSIQGEIEFKYVVKCCKLRLIHVRREFSLVPLFLRIFFSFPSATKFVHLYGGAQYAAAANVIKYTLEKRTMCQRTQQVEQTRTTPTSQATSTRRRVEQIKYTEHGIRSDFTETLPSRFFFG